MVQNAPGAVLISFGPLHINGNLVCLQEMINDISKSLGCGTHGHAKPASKVIPTSTVTNAADETKTVLMEPTYVQHVLHFQIPHHHTFIYSIHCYDDSKVFITCYMGSAAIAHNDCDYGVRSEAQLC